MTNKVPPKTTPAVTPIVSTGEIVAGKTAKPVLETPALPADIAKPAAKGPVAEMLHQVAAEVPYYADNPPATQLDVGRGRTEPRVDPKVLRGEVKPAGASTVAQSVRPAILEKSFATWADSPRPEVWQTPMGKAVAHYALHRYALADTLGQTRNKIGHAAEVTWSARAIHIEQQARFDELGLGQLVQDDWQGRMEFAGIMHDVGYMHGGFMHPGKGAADMLQNFGHFGVNSGVLPDHDVAQQIETEKVALLAQMHGQCFPWDAIDQDNLLPGDHYISVDLMLDLVKADGGFDRLRSTLREEYKEYLADPKLADGTDKFAWLEDDHTVEQLVRAGWLLHCGDKFVGPRHRGRTLDQISGDSKGARNGRPGADFAITSRSQLKTFVRGKTMATAIYTGRGSPGRVLGRLNADIKQAHDQQIGKSDDTSGLLSIHTHVFAHLARSKEACKQAVVNEREPGLAQDEDFTPSQKAPSIASMSNDEIGKFLDAEIAAIETVIERAASLSPGVRDEIKLTERLTEALTGLTAAKALLVDLPDLADVSGEPAGVEQEFKFAFPDEATLLAFENNQPPMEGTLAQHNIYFDAEGILTNSRWSLRLRIENDQPMLTLKGPKTSADGDIMVSRPETRNVEVSQDVAEQIIAGNADPMDYLADALAGTDEAGYVAMARQVLDGAIPKKSGEIRNERHVFPMHVDGLDLHLEVDRTEYPGHGRFFEVELEIPAEATKAQGKAAYEKLAAMVTDVGAPIATAPGKHTRLLAFQSGRPLAPDA